MFLGLMDEDMKDFGKMVNSMVKESIIIRKGEERKASGMKERESDGLMNLKLLLSELINEKIFYFF